MNNDYIKFKYMTYKCIFMKANYVDKQTKQSHECRNTTSTLT